jgi:molybdopterin converting factor small subunit
MNITVVYIAQIRQITGKYEEKVTVPDPLDTAGLLEFLSSKYKPLFRSLIMDGRGIRRSVMLTINNFHVSYDSSLILREGDTVSIITPMS